MHCLGALIHTLLALSVFGDMAGAARNPGKVLLSNVQSLTLRKDQKTSHRRVSPIPQLKCVGGNAKGLYEVDVMRCKNAGSSYGGDDIEWTCTASLPVDFKLGSTDVICEGYDSPDDPYILKGSCGVEYRLVLTDQGEEKYGNNRGSWWGTGSGKDHKELVGEHSSVDTFVTTVFWLVFVGVLLWIVYSAVMSRGNTARRPDVHRPGYHGGGGGGGGGGNDDDPPPPYDYQPPRDNYSKPSSNVYGTNNGNQQQGWRPGFWSGALGGAAAGYMAGNMRANRDDRTRTANLGPSTSNYGRGGAEGSSWWGNGEGSSSGRTRSSPSPSAARHESTGFGSTRRR